MNRHTLLSLAHTQMGCVDPKQYWEVVLGGPGPYPPHWCGAFYLWLLRTSGACDWPWVVGRGFLWCPGGGLRMAEVDFPELGDLVVVPEPYQHHAMLVDCRDPGRYLCIAGNIRDGRTVGYQLIEREKSVCYSVDQLIS
jgi:hypothetical protein